MYTQCPECTTAFRVTANVLKQAAGMVRCGGCQNAFNSLLFLSESMPETSMEKTSAPAVPELTPEIVEARTGLPQTISAQQSAALLKTLDELAGSDIRIEDTGVEWRVLDDDKAAVDDECGESLDTLSLDETLQASETRVDEILNNSPQIIDSPEIFEERANAFGKTCVDELRFDDNTPLPDDFDLDDESSYVPAIVPRHDVIEENSKPQERQGPQAAIALSEPEEWTDILDEFEGLGAAIAAPDEAPPLPQQDADVIQDMHSQCDLHTEATGIHVSGIQLDTTAEEACAPETTGESVADSENIDFAEETSHLDQIEEQFEPVIESHTIEEELALLDDADQNDIAARKEPLDSDMASDHFVPEMTEEEHTANMQIDQDLMALAIEDEHGFASTIVIPDKDAESEAHTKDPAAAEKYSDKPVGLETIVMEGEDIRSALEGESLQANAPAPPLAKLIITADSEPDKTAMNIRWDMVAAAVALVLLLAVQMMHQSREALATIPAFNGTVGQLYRVLGQPVQPSYDITGWRFEATKGSDNDEALTVYSRVGNNSEGPLPYPMIGISLTDRFEETIGSRMLEPAEYLPTDRDPRELVEAGSTFNAVITIQSARVDATGFKLNVCYRLSDGQLRCAINDFK